MTANVWRVLLFRFLFWTHFMAAVLVPFYTEWAGLDLTRVMLLNAWFMAWNFLLEIPTGAIADFFGRKWSMTLGALTTAAACLLYASTPTYSVFLVAEVIFALGYCLVSGADEALLYDSLVQGDQVASAERQLARLQAAQLAGIVAGALGGTFIAAAGGVRAPMMWQAVPIGLASLLAATLVEPTVPVGRTRTVPYATLLLAGVHRLRADARLRTIVADAVLVAALVWTIIWLYQPRLAAAGVSRAAFGPMHAALCVAQIAVLRSVGRLTAVTGGRARYLRAAAGIAGAAMVALAAPLPPVAVMVLLMLAMGFGQSRLPVASAAMHVDVEPAVRATVVSTVSMIRTLAICLLNPIAGIVADRSILLVFGGLGLGVLAVAAMSPLGPRHVPD